MPEKAKGATQKRPVKSNVFGDILGESGDGNETKGSKCIVIIQHHVLVYQLYIKTCCFLKMLLWYDNCTIVAVFQQLQLVED